MKLSIIIPVYNERDTVAIILQKVLAIQLENIEKEVLVVDDGSDDGTKEILRGIQKIALAHLFRFFTTSRIGGRGPQFRPLSPKSRGIL